MTALTSTYPNLLEAVIKVTLRFDESHKNEIEQQYDLNIVALKDNYYEAYSYIKADEKEYDRLLAVGDKCECIDPRHVREYIKNKAEEITKIYRGDY
jgi:predicted DNA-binding transcriptional regulator YafY